MMRFLKIYLEEKKYKIPPIIPIVIYQGEKKWNVSCRFHDIVRIPSDEFKPYLPDFQYFLFDVSKIDDN
jgi:hypothetical protein